MFKIFYFITSKKYPYIKPTRRAIMTTKQYLGIPDYIECVPELWAFTVGPLRKHLADLIENGMKNGAEEESVFSSACSPVLNHSSRHNKTWATAVGFAILGVQPKASEACKIYFQKLQQKRQLWRPGTGEFPALAAAEEILFLPYDLLYEVQTDHELGKPLAVIIQELRQ